LHTLDTGGCALEPDPARGPPPPRTRMKEKGATQILRKHAERPRRSASLTGPAPARTPAMIGASGGRSASANTTRQERTLNGTEQPSARATPTPPPTPTATQQTMTDGAPQQ
jgi:hypothetical protein